MKFVGYVVILVTLQFFGFVQAADTMNKERKPEVNYVAFNYLKGDDVDGNIEIFSDYVEKLTPVMKRHGLTLDVYRVVKGGSEHLSAHAVTFGSAPDQQAFNEFAADPEFQALLPTLLEIMHTHVTVYTPVLFTPSVSGEEGATLLSAAWLKDDKETSYSSFLALEENTEAAAKLYGATLSARTKGVMAILGLVPDELEELPPPDVFSIWNIKDPDGYYDAASVRGFMGTSDALIEEKVDFWLAPWK